MEHFNSFELPSILPEGGTLVLNSTESILSLLVAGKLVEQQVVSPLEMSLIRALVEAYPTYSPNEVLLSIVTHNSVETCRQQLLNAKEEKTMRAVTKRLREMLARCRKKLHPFGIDIVTLLSRGSILESFTREVRRLKSPERVTSR